MADIALVFGWSPDVMYDMTIDELAEWREQARIRNNPDE